ncbi:MAG: xanthine dehydrogenase family protein subunit M [Phycisphaerales bacterium]|nr:MAG: xanthine dehydrogenase family protein subunit M [Phycisphaerales bacterium]
MYVPDIKLHNATTLEEAGGTLARYAPSVRLLAGGTDLLVDLKTGRATYDHLVSINRIETLRGLDENANELRIGALTTVTQLGSAPVVRERFSPLLDATSKMAAPQIRNVATVGGNIAAAVPCADLPPILTAMNASVALWLSGDERTVPLHDFFTGPRETILRDGELLTAALVPKPPPGFGATYARFGMREGNTIAVAAVAASLLLDSAGTVQDARIILGAVAPIPKMVKEAGDALIGQKADDDSFGAAADIAMKAAEPISDVRGSADFRRELVAVLTKRALTTARDRAKETL